MQSCFLEPRDTARAVHPSASPSPSSSVTEIGRFDVVTLVRDDECEESGRNEDEDASEEIERLSVNRSFRSSCRTWASWECVRDA